MGNLPRAERYRVIDTLIERGVSKYTITIWRTQTVRPHAVNRNLIEEVTGKKFEDLFPN